MEYVEAFPELYGMATRFHREISTLFQIDTYITTNWDTYFEDECGATPFVDGEDFAFWNTKGRKVFKIHGSISNFGSIVATNEDYSRARRQLDRGSLGSALKVMLATKTIVYVGYSFSDHDFASLHRYISRELRQVVPTAYIVTLDRSSQDRFEALGLTPIFTDATYFIRTLKKHIEGDGHFLPDERFDGIPIARLRASVEHDKLHRRFRAQGTPDMVFCSAYQDGLIHAFDRILARRHTGQYSHKCDVGKQLILYDQIRGRHLKHRSYYDAAYAEGYFKGLFYLVCDDGQRKNMPFYFIQARSKGGSFAKVARRIVQRLGPNDEAHHVPFLDVTLA